MGLEFGLGLEVSGVEQEVGAALRHCGAAAPAETKVLLACCGRRRRESVSRGRGPRCSP
jgi:hypothetical protein